MAQRLPLRFVIHATTEIQMSNERKRLVLKRETVRHLGDDELLDVFGGVPSGGSTNLTIRLNPLNTSFAGAVNRKGPDDEDVRPPRLPPTFVAPSLPSPRPSPPGPLPATRPVITGASYYCG
jgi:hypothetical protein